MLKRILTNSSNKIRTAPLSTTSTTPSTSTTPIPSTTPVSSSSFPQTHYLITLLRSPLHLPAAIIATCHSLGLSHRLSSSIVPITPENAGYILRVKELVGVKMVSVEDVIRSEEKEWREREGEGRRGSGLRKTGQGEGGVIRVGSERARGAERGFQVRK